MSGVVNGKKVRKNLEEWLGNPYWAEYYRGAPSEKCREFIALEFYFSEYGDEEAAGAMDRIEEELDAAGLRYLMKCCGNSPRKGILARKITEKEAAERNLL